MKKILKFLFMFLLVISLSSVNSKQANAYDLCSGQPRCASTTLTYGVDKINSTNTVFLAKEKKFGFHGAIVHLVYSTLMSLYMKVLQKFTDTIQFLN